MSLPKKHEKSPYGPHSIKDIENAENGRYYIQVGSDIFCTEDGKMAFNKNRVEYFYFRIWDGLKDTLSNGDEISKEDAIQCLILFKIHPFRIH